MSQVGRCLIALLMAGFFPVLSKAQPSASSVLILDESGPGIPGYVEISSALRSTIKAQLASPVVIYAENLDLAQFRGPRYQEILQAFIREKYIDRPIGIIVAIGSEALKLSLQLRTDEKWSKVAIAFAAVDEDRVQSSLQSQNLTGRFLQFSLASSITAARALVPNLKQIAIVGDPLDKQPFRGHFAAELPQAAAEYSLINLAGLPLSVVRERVSTLPADSAIVYTTMTDDGAGNQYLPNEALEIVAKAANRPIVIDIDNRLGHGATGGIVVLPKIIGEEAASLVLRIFKGEDASQIPFATSQAVKQVFDWRELKRWGVDEFNLPAGSEIRFRPPTAWEQYRWQILLLAAVMLTEAALIAGLMYESRRRRTAEVESFRRMNELAHMNRMATAGELSASIAHEIKQPLAAMVTQSAAATRWLDRSAPDLAEARAALQKIAESGHRASQIIDNLRALFRKDSNPYRPLELNRLIREVLALTSREMEEHSISLTLFLGEPTRRVLGDQAQLEQVFLNLVMNGIEAMSSSSRAERVLKVRTDVDGSVGVLITVADSGPGIDANSIDKIFEAFFTTKPGGMGMGLSICRSIVEAHNGRLWASPGPTHGLVFHVSLPSVSP